MTMSPKQMQRLAELRLKAASIKLGQRKSITDLKILQDFLGQYDGVSKSPEITPEIKKAAAAFGKAVSEALKKWVGAHFEEFNIGAPGILKNAKTEADVISALEEAGASWRFYVDSEWFKDSGAWEEQEEELFKNPDSSVNKFRKGIVSAVKPEYTVLMKAFSAQAKVLNQKTATQESVMTMSPKQMQRLAELREKVSAPALPSTFTLDDAAQMYLHKIGVELRNQVKVATGTAPILSDAMDGGVVLSMFDKASGEDDNVFLTIDFEARVLKASLVANSQGGATVNHAWKLSRIQKIIAHQVAKLIYNKIQ